MYIRKLSMVAVAVALAAGPATAAMMNYGTVAGPTYTYIDVTEDNLTASDLYYAGGISISADTLLVDPDGFGAQINPGPGASLVDSELEMMIVPTDAAAGSVDQIFFSEEGDYTIVGGGSVTAAAPYFWQILEVDGTAITPISGSGQVDFSSTTPGTGVIWDLSFGVDLASQLPSPGRITKVGFRFDNTLTAAAGDTEVAFIKKKQTGGVRVCATDMNGSGTDCMVPEPNSAMLLVIGLAAMIRRLR